MKNFRDHSRPFLNVIKSRRAAINFDESVSIKRDEIEDIISLTRYAPSCFNLQHSHFYVFSDRVNREKIRKACNDQYKVLSSSAIILICGNIEAYKESKESIEAHKELMDEESFAEWLKFPVDLYQKKGENFKRDEAIRNASLSAMMLMLVTQEKGWDSCPVIGFDENEIKKVFNVKEKHLPVLLVLIGKQTEVSKDYKRPPRKPLEKLITYVDE